MANSRSEDGDFGASPERLLQQAEYGFPYHHLPNREFGRLRLGRVFRGGAEYLAYMDDVAQTAIRRGPSSVLDVGCGDGRLLATIRANLPDPNCSLHGVDLDERAIALAKAMAPSIDYRVQAIEDVQRTFDVVTCVETLEHIEGSKELAFLRSTAARTSPGGVLILTVPSTARPVSAKHHRHYDTRSLFATFEVACANLDVVRICETVPHRPWLDSVLRLLSNRQYSLDVGMINEAVARLHARPVASGQRGLHVMAVLRRPMGT